MSQGPGVGDPVSHARLEMRGVAKAFGATRALRGVDLLVAPGEVHALIGENGAGKSTLMKILSGALRADAGTIAIDGAAYGPRGPRGARDRGVAMIYQELSIAAHLSVADNIVLGAEPSRLGVVLPGRRRAIARDALARLGRTDIAVDARAGDLSVAQQQMVEIARALAGDPRVLVMDEPTSSLTRADVEHLFAAIRRLRTNGVSVIYISHFLDECRTICDRWTVLRDGTTVGCGAIVDTSVGELIRLMVGREITDIYPKVAHTIGAPALELRALAGRVRPVDASLTLRRGEILGIFGLVGSGRTETLRTVFGLDPHHAGRVLVGGVDTAGGSPRTLLRRGVGLVSENRKEEGLLLGLSIADNLTLSRLEPVSSCGVVSGSAQRAATAGWLQRLAVKAREPGQAVGELSGGNQQKVAIARLLHHGAAVLLLDEPTRGVDIGAKAAIYQLIGELAAQGSAIILVSSYIPELLGTCDTIAAMCRGTLSAARPAELWDERSLLAAAIGEAAA